MSINRDTYIGSFLNYDKICSKLSIDEDQYEGPFQNACRADFTCSFVAKYNPLHVSKQACLLNSVFFNLDSKVD